MNKNTLKRFSTFLFTITLFLIFAASVSAATIVTDQISVPADLSDSEITPMAEETEWIFRTNNGYWEKRLWSYTYGKWLTDWIVLAPVE